MNKKSELSRLKNIGSTIERRLNDIGVWTRADLERIGPAKAYQRIRRDHPHKTIPVCYYLYSLQGALLNIHWDKVPKKLKNQLIQETQKNVTRTRHASR